MPIPALKLASRTATGLTSAVSTVNDATSAMIENGKLVRIQ